MQVIPCVVRDLGRERWRKPCLRELVAPPADDLVGVPLACRFRLHVCISDAVRPVLTSFLVRGSRAKTRPPRGDGLGAESFDGLVG